LSYGINAVGIERMVWLGKMDDIARAKGEMFKFLTELWNMVLSF
jgi:hypothetical protein